MKKISKILFLVLVFCAHPLSLSAAVVLQYHHIGDSTPRVTSTTVAEFRQHLDWLKENKFSILSLTEFEKRLKNSQLNEQDKVAVITFDDQGNTVCDTAWPILKEYGYPFAVFVTTSNMTGNTSSLCSWQQLKEMVDSGLVIVGNHGHGHLHMLDKKGHQDDKSWQHAMREEITKAQGIIDQQLGKQPRIFAYPYGEYNDALELLVRDLGYTAFGQQSGAIGNSSNITGLPRFPLGGQFANVASLPDKLNSIAFPIKSSKISHHPIARGGADNPPTMELLMDEGFTSRVQCFLGSGAPLPISQQGSSIVVKSDQALPSGRSRYNCTAPSGQRGRFYWFSYQWLIE